MDKYQLMWYNLRREIAEKIDPYKPAVELSESENVYKSILNKMDQISNNSNKHKSCFHYYYMVGHDALKYNPEDNTGTCQICGTKFKILTLDEMRDILENDNKVVSEDDLHNFIEVFKFANPFMEEEKEHKLNELLPYFEDNNLKEIRNNKDFFLECIDALESKY